MRSVIRFFRFSFSLFSIRHKAVHESYRLAIGGSLDLKELRELFMGQEGRLIQVFIVVDEYDFDVNERIYDREERVMDAFDRLDFDFHITCQRFMSDPSLKKVL